MKTEVLETFIKRYSLGDLISKVKWKYSASEKTLHTRASADNRSFVVDVMMNDFPDLGPEDIVVCIGDTEKLKGMFSPFGEDINITVETLADRILGFTISDVNCEAYCASADPSSIDPVPKNLQDVPDYDVVVPLTEEFIEKFLKAHSALKDVKLVSMGMNKKDLFEVVIGYTTSNSNRIRITPPTDPVKNKLKTALAFPVGNLVEIFKSNKDIPNGTMSIKDSGIMCIYFKNDKYTCIYYQFANQKAQI